MVCWSCQRAPGEGATCATCGALQMPDLGADHFRVLGLPRAFALDLADAEARFRELSRVFHPDRFAKADPQARRASLQRSAQLNEAWRTLKDPVRRAEYLLRLAGADAALIEGSGAGSGDRPAAPPELLGEILELREELAEARAAGDDARVAGMAADLRGRLEGALARVAEAFAAEPPALAVVVEQLVAVRYFRRFLDEVAAHEEEVEARLPGRARGEGERHA